MCRPSFIGCNRHHSGGDVDHGEAMQVCGQGTRGIFVSFSQSCESKTALKKAKPCSWFTSLYSKHFANIAKELYSNKKKRKVFWNYAEMQSHCERDQATEKAESSHFNSQEPLISCIPSMETLTELLLFQWASAPCNQECCGPGMGSGITNRSLEDMWLTTKPS